jgi:hypothetical protein
MLSLLETLITFIGVMLVLALAAQSIQELIKIIFALKGQAALRGLRGLINEAVKSQGLINSAEDIYQSIVRRLQGLGQNGVRSSALRLDALTASQLADLLEHLNPAEVADLKTAQPKTAQAALSELAQRAKDWFPLAMDPVADRYRRRMRGVAFVSSAVVVLALNADALVIFRQARDDDQFRQRVGVATAELGGLHQRVRDLGGRCVKGDSAGACEELRPVLDSLDTRALAVATDTTFLAGITGPRRPKEFQWWLGILLSTLLVSLGAPFWHDALETLFGVKNRVRAETKKMEETTPPLVIERRIGPEGEEEVVARSGDDVLRA